MGLGDFVFDLIFREERLLRSSGAKTIRLTLVGEAHLVPPGLGSRVESLLTRGGSVAVEGVDKKGYPEKLILLFYAPLLVLVKLRLLGKGAILTAHAWAKQGALSLHRLEAGHRPPPRARLEIGVLVGVFLLSLVPLPLAWLGVQAPALSRFLPLPLFFVQLCVLQIILFVLIWPVLERHAWLRSLWLMGPGLIIDRNELMAKRLIQLIDEGEVGGDLVVIVGRAHLSHLTVLLCGTYGFSLLTKEEK